MPASRLPGLEILRTGFNRGFDAGIYTSHGETYLGLTKPFQDINKTNVWGVSPERGWPWAEVARYVRN